MSFLLDTHVLLWAALAPARLPEEALSILKTESNKLFYSAASYVEICIKLGLNRPEFRVDPVRLRRELRENGYSELQITVDHALALQSLPKIHKDPFDRILVAQAMSEGLVLLTADSVIARYPGPIRAF